MPRRAKRGVFSTLLIACCFCLPATQAQAPAGRDSFAKATVGDDALDGPGKRDLVSKLSQSYQLAIQKADHHDAARILNRIGHLQLRLHNPMGAVESHRMAIRLLSSPQEIIVDSLNGMAAGFFVLKDLDQANQKVREAIDLSEKLRYEEGQAEALYILSQVQNLDNHAVALETARDSLKLWRKLNDRGGQAKCYFQMGSCLLAQNRLNEASENYELALAFWGELGDRLMQAECHVHLAFVEERKAEWETAISHFVQAQGLVIDSDEPKTAGKIAAGLAEAFNENGLPENGLVQYERALQYYRQTQDPKSVRYAEWGLGWTHYLLHDYPKAIQHLETSIVSVPPNSLETTNTYTYLGRIALETGDYSTALKYFNQAKAILSRTQNPLEAAQTEALMAQVYQLRREPQNARELYTRSLNTFKTVSDRIDEAAVLFALGKLELSERNEELALSYFKESITATENIRKISSSSDLSTAFSATVHERYQSFVDCLMRQANTQANRQDQIQTAFETNELAKGRSLASVLSSTQTNLLPGLDPDLAAKEKSLRQQLRVKEDSKIRLLAGAYKKEELDRLEQELAQLDQEYKQVRQSIRTKFPSFDQLTQPVAWDLKRIQQEVVADDQTLLLEYSLGSERSYAWIITRDGFTSYELPSGKQIEEIAQRVYKLLLSSEAQKSELDQATATIAQMILFPFAERLDRRRIIVVADGSLNYIPFQILPQTPTNNQPLIANHEIVNAPSASILGQLRQENERRRQPSNLLAAFGDVAFPADFAELKNSTTEQVASAKPVDEDVWRHAIRDIELNGDKFDPSSLHRLLYAQKELNSLRELGGAGSLVVTGFDATREKLQSVDLSKYAILHFATHGILDPSRPENSGLFLSMIDRDGKPQNGFLGLQDIYNLRAPVDLVVLSACRTGLGKDVRGEGLIGLTRGFMYAGASSVVASLWKVDDEATSELMRRFYTNMLEKQMNPSAALREAQNAIRQRPEWNSPYYWAAFTIQGEFNKPIKQPGKFRWPVYMAVGAALVLATGGWWLYFRRKRLRSVTQP